MMFSGDPQAVEKDVAQAIKATVPLSARKDIFQTKLLLSAAGAVDGSKVQAKRSKPQVETFSRGNAYNELIYQQKCSKHEAQMSSY